LEKWLNDGRAWKKFVSLVYAQDGDATALEKILKVHCAPVIRPLLAKKGGTVRKMAAELIGRASVLLGGGRQKAEDKIDATVGISGIKKTGEAVDVDEPLLFVHARTERSIMDVMPLLEKGIEVD
jgi:pyrimidine-nucleoside phosphorylase